MEKIKFLRMKKEIISLNKWSLFECVIKNVVWRGFKDQCIKTMLDMLRTFSFY